jgi:hypothetical protein
MVNVVFDIVGPLHAFYGPLYRVDHSSVDDHIYQIDPSLH